MNVSTHAPLSRRLALWFVAAVALLTLARAQKPLLIFHDGSGGTGGTSLPSYVATHFESGRVIKNLPFDGMMIKTDEAAWFMAGDSPHNYSLAQFQAAYGAIDNKANVHFTNSTFRHNYAEMYVHRLAASGASGDFFDNTAWNAFYNELELFAQAVSGVVDPSGNRVFKGIIFDNEDYGMSPFTNEIFDWSNGNSFWYKNNNDPAVGRPRTFDEYVVKIRERFKEMYRRIQLGFPGCVLRTMHSPHDYGRLIWRSTGGATFRANTELKVASCMGFYEGQLAGFGGVYIEGGENYWVTTWQKEPDPASNDVIIPDGFDPYYKRSLFSFPLGNDSFNPGFSGAPRVYQPRLLSDTGNPAPNTQYPSRVLQSFTVDDRAWGESNDAATMNKGIGKGPLSAANIQRHLTFALRRCDTEVVFYTEEYDWLGTSPPADGQILIYNNPAAQPVLDAVIAARNSAATRTPGTLWYSTDFASVSGWTASGGSWAAGTGGDAGSYVKSDLALNHSSVNDSPLVNIQVYYPNNALNTVQDIAADSKLTWTDYVVQGKVKLTNESASSGMIGLLGRYQNTSNFYAFRLIDVSGTKKWDLSRVAGGVWTKLQDGTNFPGGQPWVVGTQYTLKMSFDGPAIICSISNDGGTNWTTAASYSADYTFLSGKVGLIGQNGTCAFDDVSVRYQGAAANSLVGHWTLDEGTGTTALDSSGNAIIGTLTNGPTWVADQFGGNAVDFDGVNDYVDLGTPAALNDLPAVTVAAWINPTTSGGNSAGRIFAKGNGTNPTAGFRLCLFNQTAPNQLTFAADYSTTDMSRVSTAAIPFNQWTHVAATWTGTSAASGVTLYINGSPVTYSASNDGQGVRNSDVGTSVRIGNNQVADRGFDGAIDAVRVYNYALSASEVAALAQPPGGAPEINVQGNGVTIADGDTTPSTADHTDFGSADINGTTVTRTYTIQNTGTAALTVGTVTLSGTNAADFSVTAQPAASVAAGGSTTFNVRFDPSATGTRTASLSFSDNDSNENPYNYSIKGTGTAIAWRAAASANSGTASVNSLQINKPSGVVNGDTLIAAISIGLNDIGTVAAPSGWTLVRQIDDDFRLLVYRKTASGEPANYTWSWSTGPARKVAGGIVALSGANPTNPIQVENGAAEPVGGLAVHSTPTIATTGASTWLVSIFADKNGSGSTWTPPAGTNERLDTRATGTGNDPSVAIYTQGPVAAGNKSQTATASVVSQYAAMEIIAIQP